ncbi:uncharacterized protein LOC129723323 [Wyeomyia smithii]|uniref:uncharacterized protein LOC129723323 n=1 Tax=Wyeomyia smithii TaxID=174621 RepID=UPI002467F81C|nr:uncharacterized protein LOC129723323 [Wyeomyia smithii]XP_055533455.1 uncharacterized protein LOC129723323 [Wyeomyia smithii]XP_055533456.1 uncharacterized protein LOC129723323 [Wyeomyia smithii]XP_055533458.1 uncharacterized protein LOC129723323 [Wyeomyia smithii]XP_055533459.1 uncharacterized protein LOC129723323 [Wyeomyia smithii]XP_055533460.1 uncharacterized protein LOC129723323 [Wyeomyia smithii]XP_055533461.1 uncharacterized protein LOC129723323 [Wyeomyia smithii]XP_055533462.1 unc
MSKTIETHLQSKEVRIPKKTEFDVSSTAAPCQYFKSSFARSLSFSQAGEAGPYGAAEQHFTRSLDFEVNFGLSTIPDHSGTGSSQTTPSASPVFETDRNLVRVDSEKIKLTNGIDTSNGGVVKTLWSYAKISDTKPNSTGGTPSKSGLNGVTPTIMSPSPTGTPSGSGSSLSKRKSVEANEIEVLRLRKECQNLIEENRRLVNRAANSGYAINGVMNGGGVSTSGASGFGLGRSSLGNERVSSSSLASLGLGLAGGGSVVGSVGTAAGMYSSVESVILQTQVETLQWQLKQVDSSRQMYRAVMEEVVRYLDRCYRGLDALQPSIIGRSKSVLQVSKNHNHHDSDSSSASSPRARSSTNLVDVQKTYTKKQQELLSSHQQKHHQNGSIAASPLLDDNCPPPSPAGSYSTFRDFTWRRSPKRTQTLAISSTEVDPEKLSQEAFRLLRTVQNLLNTQEPTLSQSSTALDSLLLASAAGSTTGSTSTLTGTAGGGSSAPMVHHHHHHHHVPAATGEGLYTGVVNTRSNVGFSRKLNMRGSRLSLRSSTDDSVHSTSSSNKAETDEDNMDRPSPPLGHHLHNHHHHPLVHQHQNSGSSSSSSTSSNSGHLTNHRHSANIDRIKEMMITSSAEDESGFSSMNSFQEIGLPLVNSTIMSSSSTASSTNGVCSVDSNSSAASSTGSVSFDDSSDIKDSTVIPTTNNVTTIAINSANNTTPATATASSSTNTGKQLSDKLGIPSKIPEIPVRVTQSSTYEHHSHFINHRRWDSAPVVPPKLKIHQHNADSDSGVSPRVLWV